MDIHQTEIDGVPTFWAESNGPFRGSLVFRVGRADETLPTSGMSHMVEHLALHPLAPGSNHPSGGLVDDTRTIFFADGTRDEVSKFLSSVAAGLRSLDTTRLGEERRVLMAEAASYGTGHELWRWRFGPQGYGLVSYEELGLQWIEGEALQNWANERMNRSNAVLWFSGEPPADLSLDLPDGARIAPPTPQPIPEVALPSYVNAQSDAFGLSFMVRRSVGTALGVGMLIDRANDHLRRNLGLSYTVLGNYWRLTPEDAHAILGADCAPGHAPAVRDALFEVLDQMTSDGPTEAELGQARTQTRRQWSRPEAVQSQLDTHASNALVGAPNYTSEELYAGQDELTPEDIAEMLREGLESLILTVPPSLGVPGERAVPYGRDWTAEPVEGRKYKARDLAGRVVGEVIVGEGGVSRQERRRPLISIPYDECVCVGLHGDFELTLVSRRGDAVSIEFDSHRQREEITSIVLDNVDPASVALLDRHVPAHREEVQRVAKEQLGSDDLRAMRTLPRVLLEGESVVQLARGRADETRYILAVTDFRTLFFVDQTGELVGEVPHESVRSLKASSRLMRSSLEIDAGSGTAKFVGFPGKRAEAVAAAIEALRGAGVSPGAS